MQKVCEEQVLTYVDIFLQTTNILPVTKISPDLDFQRSRTDGIH